MSTLRNVIYERTPLDILVRNFLQTANRYQPIAEYKFPHPVDIYERNEDRGREIAVKGSSKKEIRNKMY